MFVDASALVAIIAGEEDADSLLTKLTAAKRIAVSPVVIYETTAALARLSQNNVQAATELVNNFIEETKAEVFAIDRSIGDQALDAFQRFGKGRHRANLNMGDCFAYACAKSQRMPLLCKGDDFIHTDIRIA